MVVTRDPTAKTVTFAFTDTEWTKLTEINAIWGDELERLLEGHISDKIAKGMDRLVEKARASGWTSLSVTEQGIVKKYMRLP